MMNTKCLILERPAGLALATTDVDGCWAEEDGAEETDVVDAAGLEEQPANQAVRRKTKQPKPGNQRIL